MSSKKDTRRRVKVYKLNESGSWDDTGTGHVSVVHVDKIDALALVVKPEDKGEESPLLMESKIQMDDIYQRQQDTLIVWQEPETGEDVALSFQEEAGCVDVWEQICAVQGRSPFESDENDLSDDDDQLYDLREPYLGEDTKITLPPANLNNLQNINEVLDTEEYTSNVHKTRIAQAVLAEGYLIKLVQLFHICEESKNMENLHTMFHIFKNLILLNDPTLLEKLFSDEYFMDVVGALEYDPEIPINKISHREYLKNRVVFKEVVPIHNAETLQKIHNTFRMQYVKDVVLPRLLDDLTFNSINSLIYFSQIEIVSNLYCDEDFLPELFSKLLSDEASETQLTDLLSFTQEMCTLAKNLEAGQQKRFYSTLITQGIFLVLAKVLAHSNIKIRLSCADLINNVLTNDPNQVREFILSQKDSGYTFMHGLVYRVLHDSDTGIVTQYAEIIKCLLQTETMEDVTDRDKFLTLFYSEFLKRLVAALNDQEGGAETSPSKSGVLSFVPHQPSQQPHVTPLGKRKAGAAHLDQNEKGEGKGKEEEGKGEKEATETNEEKEKEGKANKKATKITENGPERDRVGKTPSATMMPFIDIQPHQSAVKHEICELLAFCVQNHGYHIKYFILGNNVASKVLKLLTHPEKHLVLAALRFFRAMVGAKDEFYNRHIIKFDLFQPIMELFKRNGSRYNLINSAIIELFDFIRKQNIKSLLHYLVNHFKQEFKAVTYVDTFKLLILKYKQNKDYQDNYHDKATSTTTASERPEDSDNDDSYFFLGEDEEEEATKEKEKNATAKKAKKRAAALAAATKNTKETAEREGKEEDEEDEEDEDYKPGEEDEEGDGDQQKRKAIKPTTNGGTSEEEEEEEEEDKHEILDRTEFLKRKREEEERQKAAEAKQRENERAKQKAAVAEMIAKEQQQEGSSMVLVGGEGVEKEEGESRGEDGAKEEGEEERASKRLRFTIQKAGGPTVTPTTSPSPTASSSLSLKKNT